MRAFLALDIPENTVAALTRLQTAIPFGRPVPEDNLHLTLAFLDDAPEAELEDLHELLTGLRAHRRLQTSVDPVPREQEEPRSPRRHAEVGNEAVPVLARGESLEVENRDHATNSLVRAPAPMNRSIRDATRARCRSRLAAVELSIR